MVEFAPAVTFAPLIGLLVLALVIVPCKLPVAPIEISHMPRPCVAMRRMRFEFWIAISKTATRGRPLLNGVHVAPPSVER